MGRKILEIPQENEGFQKSWGGGPRDGSAESVPRVALSMGKKINEIPQENEGFWKPRGLMHSAGWQNLSLG